MLVGSTPGSPTTLGIPARDAASTEATAPVPQAPAEAIGSAASPRRAAAAAPAALPPLSSTSGATLRPPSRPPEAFSRAIASSTPITCARQRSAAGPERSATASTCSGGAPAARGTPTSSCTGGAVLPSTVTYPYHVPSAGTRTGADHVRPPCGRSRALSGAARQSAQVRRTRTSFGVRSPGATPTVTTFAPVRAGASPTGALASGSSAVANAGPANSVPRCAGSGWPRPCARPDSVVASTRMPTTPTTSPRSSSGRGPGAPSPRERRQATAPASATRPTSTALTITMRP